MIVTPATHKMRGLKTLRKWLVIFAVLAIAAVGTLWWLGTAVDGTKPAPGETRVEIENVF